MKKIVPNKELEALEKQLAELKAKGCTQIIEENKEGLLALMGKNVLLFCLNYIYTGKLVGVNDTFCMLENAKIVYMTGAFDKKQFEDAQALPFNQYVQLSALESFGETNKS